MKIAQITPYYHPSIGGVESVVKFLSEELVRRGHEVHVLTAQRGHKNTGGLKLLPFEIVNGVTVHRYKSLINIGHMSVFPKAATTLWKNDFDIIHGHVYRHPHNEIAAWIGHLKSIPIVLHGHSPFVNNELITSIKNIAYRLYDIVESKKLLRIVDSIICLNEYEKNQYLKLGIKSEKLEVIGNAIDDVFFKSKFDGKKFKIKYKLDGYRILLFVGNLNKIKRLDITLHALYQIRQKIANVKLVIVGPDEGTMAQIKHLAGKLNIEDKIIITGPLYDEEKMNAYAAAEIFILPSDSDMYPLVLMEAMSHGLAVIGSDTVGSKAIIEEGKSGLIFKMGSVEGCASAISYLLDNPIIAKSMGKIGYKIARKKFSISSFTDKIEALYLKLKTEKGVAIGKSCSKLKKK